MKIAMIAGIGKNRELGKDNTLLWHLPADMKHFREVTRGHAMIMGRKTFESFPNGALPGRQNIVITRDPKYTAPDITVAHSLLEAVTLADIEKYPGEIFVIGGAQIYNEAIDRANTLYITHVDGDFLDADTFFPEIDEKKWKKVSEEPHEKDEVHPYNYTFVTYEKIIST